MAANIAVTTDQVGLVDPIKATVKTYKAASAVTIGQVVYLLTAGTVAPADGNGATALYTQVVGVALNAGGAGQSIDVCENGELYGFTVSGEDCGALLFLSDDVGRINDTTGTHTAYIGRVTCLTDASATKVMRVQVVFAQAFVA